METIKPPDAFFGLDRKLPMFFLAKQDIILVSEKTGFRMSMRYSHDNGAGNMFYVTTGPMNAIEMCQDANGDWCRREIYCCFRPKGKTTDMFNTTLDRLIRN